MQLIGKWNWEYSEICDKPDAAKQNQKSKGYTEELKFNGAIVKLLRNDSVLNQSAYEVMMIDDGKKVISILKSEIYHGIIAIENDQLSISECPGDGVNRVFGRKKE